MGSRQHPDDDFSLALALQKAEEENELARKLEQEQRDIELARKLEESLATNARSVKEMMLGPEPGTESDAELARALSFSWEKEALQVEKMAAARGTAAPQTSNDGAHHDAVAELESMGFARGDALAALERFNGRTEQAADWLLNGGSSLKGSEGAARSNPGGMSLPSAMQSAGSALNRQQQEAKDRALAEQFLVNSTGAHALKGVNAAHEIPPDVLAAAINAEVRERTGRPLPRDSQGVAAGSEFGAGRGVPEALPEVMADSVREEKVRAEAARVQAEKEKASEAAALAESELTAALEESAAAEAEAAEVRKARLLSQRSFQTERRAREEEHLEEKVLGESEFTAALHRARLRAEQA